MSNNNNNNIIINKALKLSAFDRSTHIVGPAGSECRFRCHWSSDHQIIRCRSLSNKGCGILLDSQERYWSGSGHTLPIDHSTWSSMGFHPPSARLSAAFHRDRFWDLCFSSSTQQSSFRSLKSMGSTHTPMRMTCRFMVTRTRIRHRISFSVFQTALMLSRTGWRRTDYDSILPRPSWYGWARRIISSMLRSQKSLFWYQELRSYLQKRFETLESFWNVTCPWRRMSTNSSVHASTIFDSSAWFAVHWMRMRLMLWSEHSFTVV